MRAEAGLLTDSRPYIRLVKPLKSEILDNLLYFPDKNRTRRLSAFVSRVVDKTREITYKASLLLDKKLNDLSSYAGRLREKRELRKSRTKLTLMEAEENKNVTPDIKPDSSIPFEETKAGETDSFLEPKVEIYNEDQARGIASDRTEARFWRNPMTFFRESFSGVGTMMEPPGDPGCGGGGGCRGNKILALSAAGLLALGTLAGLSTMSDRTSANKSPAPAVDAPVAAGPSYPVGLRRFENPDHYHMLIIGRNDVSSLTGIFQSEVAPLAKELNPALAIDANNFRHENAAHAEALKQELSGPNEKFYSYLRDRYIAELKEINRTNPDISFTDNPDLVQHFRNGYGHHLANGQHVGKLGEMRVPITAKALFKSWAAEFQRG